MLNGSYILNKRTTATTTCQTLIGDPTLASQSVEVGGLSAVLLLAGAAGSRRMQHSAAQPIQIYNADEKNNNVMMTEKLLGMMQSCCVDAQAWGVYVPFQRSNLLLAVHW
jgi:hypothetical protein